MPSDKIEATSHHPFWVIEGQNLAQRPAPQDVELRPERSTAPGRWVDACLLQSGDVLLLKDHGPETIRAVAFRQTKESVYNFQVAELHTYAVGKSAALVHNAQGCTAAEIAAAKKAQEAAEKSAQATRSASESLPQLKGKSEHEVRKILEEAGYTRRQVSNSAGRNETWIHPDGSEVRIHPYGNVVQAPYKSANNAHIHKEDPLGNQLNDRGRPSTNPSDTHIGIPNPPDLPTVRGRPHGAGSQ